LNEKVRAIQARRNNPALQTQTVETHQTTTLDVEPATGAAAVRQPELHSRSRATPSRERHSEPLKQSSSRTDQRSSDTIVEAALTRVRRASENASRAALPKIEPVRPMAQTSPLGIDKEATARALEPSPEITQRARPSTLPLPDVAPTRITRPEITEEPQRITRKIEASPSVDIEDTEDSFIAVSEAVTEHSRVIVLDEDSPLDYLEAEIRKVDQVLSAELSRNDSPSLFTHIVINVIDLFTIVLSSTPFLALIGLYNGSFALNQTRTASIVIIFLIAFFYLALTQCLCGRTFGMMFTNTQVIDARTAEPVTPQRALWRSAGYILAVAPAMIGLMLIAFNRKRRGLHDYITDTQVACDF
jgi:uncharacterized RDD family membrane protein YckC